MGDKITMEQVETSLVKIAEIINDNIGPNFVENPKGDPLMDEIGQLLEKHFNYPLHRNYN